MMSSIGCVVVLIAGLMSSSCTSLHAELPASRFESPETNGVEHRFGVQASVGSAHNDSITPDASARPPDFSQPSLDSDTVVGLAASLGLVERLDIGVRGSFGPSPTMFVVKYQLAGPDARAAKAGDVSVAITGAVGGGKYTKSGDQSGTFGPGGHNWSGSVESQTTDAALIVGQRLSDHVLLYGGGFYANYVINSNIDQKASDDGTSPAASYSRSTGAWQRGANLGIEFIGGGGYIQIEGVCSDASAGGLGHSLLNVGLAGGLNF